MVVEVRLRDLKPKSKLLAGKHRCLKSKHDYKTRGERDTRGRRVCTATMVYTHVRIPPGLESPKYESTVDE